MPGVYRVEVSQNNRAGCKNKECKDAGTKILKGQMRFGTFVTIKDFQSFQWKHWGCVTPKQIINIKDAIDDDVNNLDGYEDLPEDLQEKIATAIQEGHVADEDWNGDVEMNRPGKNGFRTPETKKARKEEARAREEGTASPSKPPKKRGHVQDDPDGEGVEHDSPPAKKKKTKVERVKKEPQAQDEPEVENPSVKKGRKKTSKVKSEIPPDLEDMDGNDDAAPPSIKKTRAKPKAKSTKKIKDEDLDADRASEADELVPSPKKSQTSRKSKTSKQIKAEEADDAVSDALDPAVSVPAKKTKASRKKAAANDIGVEEGNVDDGNEGDAGPVSAGPKVSSKVKKEEEMEVASGVELDAETDESVPKPKKRGRKSAKKTGKIKNAAA